VPEQNFSRSWEHKTSHNSIPAVKTTMIGQVKMGYPGEGWWILETAQQWKESEIWMDICVTLLYPITTEHYRWHNIQRSVIYLIQSRGSGSPRSKQCIGQGPSCWMMLWCKVEDQRSTHERVIRSGQTHPYMKYPPLWCLALIEILIHDLITEYSLGGPTSQQCCIGN
jgi:hypothetical protein